MEATALFKKVLHMLQRRYPSDHAEISLPESLRPLDSHFTGIPGIYDQDVDSSITIRAGNVGRMF
jgi:hypothetical protein